MADLLIELRCEELPASMIRPALVALEKGLLGLLEGVERGDTRLFSTPRRLCVVVQGLALAKPLQEKLVTGPGLAIAKKNGEWTRAAQGFARGKGVAVEDLQVVDGPKGPVIAANVRSGGEQVVELVAKGLEKLVVGLPFRKSMRWGVGAYKWGRPLHQVVAVFDGERVPATVMGIDTSTAVVGHRLSELPPGEVRCADSYLRALEERCVLADRDARRQRIEQGVQDLAETHGVDASVHPKLLEEVTDLLEWPMPIVGRFEPELLALPDRLLVESMRVHQRYFPSHRDGKLHNLFFIVSNNPFGDSELIALGNARVIAARFHDAKFFLSEDRKLTLEEHGADLGTMRWVRSKKGDLGTMADKQARAGALGAQLAPLVGADPQITAQAGALCKSDLLSQMVGEFPELQGHMGRLYAEHQGLPTAAAMAIEEHYQPKNAADSLPASPEGRALALADRLDTLAGCFSIGLMPKGSADPQGLRRAANGVVAIALGAELRVSLDQLVGLGLEGIAPVLGTEGVNQDHKQALLKFIGSRLRATLMAQGHSTDFVDAVLKAGADDPLECQARVAALTWLSKEAGADFSALMTTFKRVLNISKDHRDVAYDAAAFTEPAATALAAALEEVREGVVAQVGALQVRRALERLVALRPTVDTLFDDVMVMAEDPAVRTNRLSLVAATAQLFLTIADFRLISTE